MSFEVKLAPQEINSKGVAWYTVHSAKSTTGKQIYAFQSITAPFIEREENRFTPSMVICTDRATGKEGQQYCTLKSNWESNPIIAFDTNTNKFYYSVNWAMAKGGVLEDITSQVQRLNYVAPPDFLKKIAEESDKGNMYADEQKEGEGVFKQDQQAEYETSGKVKPFGRDQSGMIETPLALLIPEWLHINSSWFDGKNPELSKKFNRFILLLIGVGVLAYGRKRRVARRTARRTSKRTTRRNLTA